MVDLSHVFKRHVIEKDISAVHEVAGLTKISSQSFLKVDIINFLLLRSTLTVLWISLKQVGYKSRKIVMQTSFLLLNNQPQYRRDSFHVRNHAHPLCNSHRLPSEGRIPYSCKLGNLPG